MFYTPPAGTHYYRVTARGRVWADVLSGAGAFFSFGGRYNRVQQKTVYAAEDPLVSITEYAFHLAVDLQMLLGGGPLSTHPPLVAPPLPLASEHFLWCFRLHSAPQLVDVEAPLAIHTFHHDPYELMNPTCRDYHRTVMLADQIRHHPNPHNPVADGILAPSVRTLPSPGYIPQQHILFVPHNVVAIPGTQVRRWRLTIEFTDMADQEVTPATRDIDWVHPRFRLGGAVLPVPAFAPRPHAQPFVPGAHAVPYPLEIKFA